MDRWDTMIHYIQTGERDVINMWMKPDDPMSKWSENYKGKIISSCNYNIDMETFGHTLAKDYKNNTKFYLTDL